MRHVAAAPGMVLRYAYPQAGNEAILADFHDLGSGIAVDDFGTGYSALSYLRRFPVTILKIDRVFVSDIETNAADAHLVESIVAMARALRIAVVAEGVERAGQAHMLRAMGCGYAQGYLYGRPVPAAEFAASLHTVAASSVAVFEPDEFGHAV